MNTEALIDNDTFELVPCPKDRQIVGAKWVYTIKTDQNEKKHIKLDSLRRAIRKYTRHRLSGNIRTHSTHEHDTHVTATRSAE